jgi:hypothetical protein
MRTKSANIFVAILLLTGSFGLFTVRSAFGQRLSQSTPDQTPTVSICELVRQPNKYDQKQVRVHGVYLRTDRYTSVFDLFFYDPNCNADKTQMLLLSLEYEHWDKLREEMWQMFPAGKCDQASLTAVGVFNVYQNPPPYREFVKYGFAISKFEKGKCLASGNP